MYLCRNAAGRKKSKTCKRNDFSDTDYKFTLNVEFKFFTPQAFFLNEKSEYPLNKILYMIITKIIMSISNMMSHKIIKWQLYE